MIVCVGIFAHNEEKEIANTLRDLFTQDLFEHATSGGWEIEIACIANGCTDGTIRVAEKAIAAGLRSLGGTSQVTYRIDELERPNKADAWNHYIHHASRPDADYIICLDADISLPQKNCLTGVLKQLQHSPEAYVAVDRPVKDIVKNPHSKGIKTSLNRLVTREKAANRTPGKNSICGQLFCGRTEKLREVWLPKGLVRVMDGFIKAMVVTNCFTTPEQHHRLVVAEDCYHTFKAYNTLGALFRHNRNLLVGMVVNAIVYDYLWKHSGPSKHAGELIRARNDAEPNWLHSEVDRNLSSRRRRGMLLDYATYPLRQLKNSSSPKSLRELSVAWIQFSFRIPVAVAADRQLRSKRFEW